MATLGTPYDGPGSVTTSGESIYITDGNFASQQVITTNNSALVINTVESKLEQLPNCLRFVGADPHVQVVDNLVISGDLKVTGKLIVEGDLKVGGFVQAKGFLSELGVMDVSNDPRRKGEGESQEAAEGT